MDLKQENLMFGCSVGCSGLGVPGREKPLDGHFRLVGSYRANWNFPCWPLHFSRVEKWDGWWNFKMVQGPWVCWKSLPAWTQLHLTGGWLLPAPCLALCQPWFPEARFSQINLWLSTLRIQVFEIWAWHGTEIKSLIIEKCFLLKNILGKWFCECI